MYHYCFGYIFKSRVYHVAILMLARNYKLRKFAYIAWHRKLIYFYNVLYIHITICNAFSLYLSIKNTDAYILY